MVHDRTVGPACSRRAGRGHRGRRLPRGVPLRRLEKSYRAHGNELELEYDLVEAGMAGPAVKDVDFIGRDPYLKQRAEEPAAVLCTLTVDDPTSASGVKRYMLGREPILSRDGEPLVDAKGRRSHVTSAGSGP